MSKLALARWGPAMWHTLHAVAHTAPRVLSAERREETRRFLRAVVVHIPCPRCAEHFSDFLDRRMDDASLATRASLVALLNDAHNEVNARTGKRIWTLEEHCRAYLHHDHHLRPLDWAAAAAVVAAMVTVVVVADRAARTARTARTEIC